MHFSYHFLVCALFLSTHVTAPAAAGSPESDLYLRGFSPDFHPKAYLVPRNLYPRFRPPPPEREEIPPSGEIHPTIAIRFRHRGDRSRYLHAIYHPRYVIQPGAEAYLRGTIVGSLRSRPVGIDITRGWTYASNPYVFYAAHPGQAQPAGSVPPPPASTRAAERVTVVDYRSELPEGLAPTPTPPPEANPGGSSRGASSPGGRPSSGLRRGFFN